MAINTSHTVSALRNWAIWTLGFFSFPLAGIAGGAISGPVDSRMAAALGGRRIIKNNSTGQWLASGRRLRADRWIPATTVGMGLGLLIGATVVGFGTDLADLAVMGALTGISLGIAQAMALPSRSRFRWVWAAVMPALWSLGWTITTLVCVGRRCAVHGLRIHCWHHRLRPDRSRPPVHRPVLHHRCIHRHFDRGLLMSDQHVIFGTGAIGLALCESLRRRDVGAIRMVNRSGKADVPTGVEVVAADVSDPALAVAAAKGATSVYQALNPPYAQWVELFPGLQAGVVAAAEAAQARLVSMENVYMYGRPAGSPLTEDRPYLAHTKKGQLRGRMADALMAAHRAGRIEVAIGRASDYFGPNGGAQSNLGDRLFGPALAGKTASLLGD